jgi:AbiV family abortive infection protein
MADDRKEDHDALELARGARLSFENAEGLFREAEILFGHGALSRALFLHQISMEECAKIEMIGAWMAGSLGGIPAKNSGVKSALSRHKAKNNTNAYMLPLSEEEQRAREQVDSVAALQAFKESQARFHSQSNERKNASLYVDYENGHFQAPSEIITEAMVLEIAERNFQHIQLCGLKVNMLEEWANDLDKVRPQLSKILQKLEELRTKELGDPGEALNAILKSILGSKGTGDSTKK